MLEHPSNPSVEDLSTRLSELERRNRQLSRWLLSLCLAALVVVLGFNGLNAAAKAEPGAEPQGVLKVRELVVVDDNGVVRARVGANLPDAVIDGRRVGRGGEKVSGVMLYDASGQERGGYVTFEPSGNVGLTLDSRERQTALFVAGPDGGSALQLFTPTDMIELRSDSDGSRLTAIKDGNILRQIPQISDMTPNTCSAYKEALSRVSPAQVRKDCQRRFPSGACNKCLGVG